MGSGSGLARRVAPVGALLAALACGSAGSDLGTGVTVRRTVSVGVFLDRDGSISITAADTVFAGARIALLPRIGNDTIRVLISNSMGVANFTGIQPGQYRLGVTQSSIGDSIEVQEMFGGDVEVQAALPDPEVLVRLGYPTYTIQEARALPPGIRLFVKGLVISGPQMFRDTTAHLRDAAGFIRLTRVSIRNAVLSNPGDSISALGRTALRGGQPTLDETTIAILGLRPPPVETAVTTEVANHANVGALDAALVIVSDAIVTDTATIGPDFRVLASDGTGTVAILIDPTLSMVTTEFRPGRSLDVRGVLVPDGLGAWSIKPRASWDIGFNN